MSRIEFSRTTKAKRFDYCGGFCEGCGIKLTVGKFEYDHDKECEDDGGNSFENCRVLCSPCHREKTTGFIKRIRKADRQKAKHIGATTSRRNPMPGSRKSPWKRKMNGQVVRREP